MRKNYQWKLLQEIITGNYELVYQSLEECEIYRDTGVSKNYQQKLLQKNYKLVYYDVENVGIIQKKYRNYYKKIMS
jgi:hypothetical protein